MGVAMGLTAIGIIYSPWGKQSGAHLNPAVTLSARFWLNAQAAYDLEVAQDELQRTIERDVRPPAGSAQTSRA